MSKRFITESSEVSDKRYRIEAPENHDQRDKPLEGSNNALDIPDPREEQMCYEWENSNIEAEIEGVLPNEEQVEGVAPRVNCEPVQSGSGEKALPIIEEEEPAVIDLDDGPKTIVEADILSSSERQRIHFNTVEINKRVRIKFNLRHYDGNIDTIAEELDYFYKRLLDPIINNRIKYSSSDLYSVAISSPLLKAKPFFISPKKIIQFSDREFTDITKRVTMSNEQFILKELDFRIYVTKSPSGKGYSRESTKNKAPIDLKENARRMKCCIQIKNEDNSCGYRAIYVGSTYYSAKFSEIPSIQRSERYNEWRQMIGKNYDDHYQKNGTEDFINKVNQFMHNTKCGENCGPDCDFAKRFRIDTPLGSHNTDYDHMNQYLNSIGQSLVVVDANKLPKNAQAQINPPHIYRGGKEEEGPVVYLELQTQDKGHFNFIKDIKAYLKTQFFCRSCHIGHWSIKHQCDGICTVCGHLPKCEGGETVICEACNIIFVNQKCYDNHLENTAQNFGPRCKDRKRCEKCLVYYKNEKKTKHKCNEYLCKDCGKRYTEQPHYCMLKPLDIDKLEKEDEVNKIIVSFDIESTLISTPEGDLHKANLLISDTVCENCWDDQSLSKRPGDCETCGKGTRSFRGYSCVQQFTNYLYSELAPKAEKNKNRILVFAHNSKGYDGHFIMEDFFTRSFKDMAQMVMQGLKILKIGINNIDFIDSLSFFMQPLCKLPKNYGFQDMVEKGFFPHKFNREENWNYIGPIPHIDEFGIEFMKRSTAKECIKWHSEYKGNWNFQCELHKYCRDDVRILTIALMKFRRLFKSITKLDPVTRNFTLASVAMEYFRSSVLQEDEIGINPIKGYFNQRKSSMKGNIWLDWQQKTRNQKIYREYRIGPYYVDGYNKETNTIFEFFGCFFHGCNGPECNKNKSRTDDMPILNNKCLNKVLSETKDRIEYFEERGYKIEYIWEHQYDDQIITDSSLRIYYGKRFGYYKKIEKYGHLNIRDAFFGGRTNNLYFTYQCEESEVIRYVDFTSLYPSVLVHNPYPLGHPIALNEIEGTDISGYFGIIKCKVSAPKDLYLPVLPFRATNKKLLFPLCPLCAETQTSKCEHTNKERQFVGTWFSEELKLAVTKGYKIDHIYEVLHWDRKSQELFKPFIQKWYKEKAEASGWPPGCDTEEQKQEYLREFYEIEGIELDREQIEFNAEKRETAKLQLNAFWGKFGQNPNQGQYIICDNYAQYYKLISDAKYEITGIIPVGDQKMIVTYKFSDDSYAKPGNTSVAIAAMVTGYARIKLYKELDKIEASSPGRVLYFDTDSVIFKDKHRSAWYNPKIGDFLGEMTDEVVKDYGPESFIDKFTSGGPKNYAYTVQTPNGEKMVTKVKGLNITHGLVDELNFECVKEYAEKYKSGDKESFKTFDQLQFRSTKLHSVYTSIFPKKYRAVSEKRIVLNEGPIQTLPYGYISLA